MKEYEGKVVNLVDGKGIFLIKGVVSKSNKKGKWLISSDEYYNSPVEFKESQVKEVDSYETPTLEIEFVIFLK